MGYHHQSCFVVFALCGSSVKCARMGVDKVICKEFV